MRSLLACYNEIVVAIEELRTIRDISREALARRLCANEMTTLGKELFKIKIAFKASVTKYDSEESTSRILKDSSYAKKWEEIMEEERNIDEIEALIKKIISKSSSNYERYFYFEII